MKHLFFVLLTAPAVALQPHGNVDGGPESMVLTPPSSPPHQKLHADGPGPGRPYSHCASVPAAPAVLRRSDADPLRGEPLGRFSPPLADILDLLRLAASPQRGGSRFI